MAKLILVVALVRTRAGREELGRLDRRSWLLLAGLGLLMYSLTQGAQFVALDRVPAVMVNLVLTFTPAFVALLSIRLLREPPTGAQWLGMLVLLAGALLYLDFAWPEGRHLFGFAVAIFGMAANGGAALLGRYVNRGGGHRPLVVTAVSMTVGSAALVTAGLLVINNTMLIQVAILAWVFLGEELSGRQIVAVVIAALGALIVQLRPDRNRRG